jgi:hypothetical protein
MNLLLTKMIQRFNKESKKNQKKILTVVILIITVKFIINCFCIKKKNE